MWNWPLVTHLKFCRSRSITWRKLPGGFGCKHAGQASAITMESQRWPFNAHTRLGLMGERNSFEFQTPTQMFPSICLYIYINISIYNLGLRRCFARQKLHTAVLPFSVHSQLFRYRTFLHHHLCFLTLMDCMSIVYCLLSIVYCLLSIVYCLLSIVYCLLYSLLHFY